MSIVCKYDNICLCDSKISTIKISLEMMVSDSTRYSSIISNGPGSRDYSFLHLYYQSKISYKN